MLSDKELAEGKRRAAKATFLPWGEHDLWWTRSGMAPYDTAKKNAAFAVWAANNAEALIAEVERLRAGFVAEKLEYTLFREACRASIGLRNTAEIRNNAERALAGETSIISANAVRCIRNAVQALTGEGGKDGLDGTTGDK